MPRTNRLLLQESYTEIKRRIVTLELGPGQRINAHELAEELGASRTPVREAMFMLASEGLVDIESQAGFVVRPLDLLDVADLFEAHVVLAKAVSHLAALRATNDDIDAMEKASAGVDAAIAAQDYFAITTANAELHGREARAARSRHLRDMISSIHDQEQRLAYLCFGGGRKELDGLSDHFERVRRDHGRLISAYKRHDPEAATKVATAHVVLFRERVQTFIASSSLKDLGVDEELALVER